MNERISWFSVLAGSKITLRAALRDAREHGMHSQGSATLRPGLFSTAPSGSKSTGDDFHEVSRLAEPEGQVSESAVFSCSGDCGPAMDEMSFEFQGSWRVSVASRHGELA